MEWEEFVAYIIDTVINETIIPTVDIVSGNYMSIEDQLK